jgi:hypothetical protein
MFNSISKHPLSVNKENYYSVRRGRTSGGATCLCYVADDNLGPVMAQNRIGTNNKPIDGSGTGTV